MNRVVEPEILDELAAGDPAAVRSRRDLRMINGLMGNFRWMRKTLKRFPRERLVELGAGDGVFLASLGGRDEERVGVDLARRPEGIGEGVDWVEGDVLEVLEGVLQGGEVVIANLFLHHFEGGPLGRIGGLLGECRALCFSEPHRSRLALAEGYLLHPFVNHVTRHDMMVSIRAGFRRGELPQFLGLDPQRWELREGSTLLGAHRLLAWRK